MRRYGLVGVGLMMIVVGLGVGLSWGRATPSPSEARATLAEVTASPSLTLTASLSPTLNASPTPTPSATLTPSLTATLATRVVQVQWVMPDVTLPPTSTPLPDHLQILAEAPSPIEPLPNATLIPFPYMDFTGWVAFESDHPAMQYVTGEWTPIGSLQASQGQYHYTEDTEALVRFTFMGEAVRVRYVGFTNGGVWQVVLDGQVVDQVDSYAPIGQFPGTRVYNIGTGEHTLELRNTVTVNPASRGHMLAFDAVQVYRPDALTLILPGGVLPSPTPTATLIPASEIELIAAPPSPQPTATDIPIQGVSASIVIGYDENANGVLDVSEGVRGLSVRLVEVGTNHVLAHTFTDEQGFAQLQASTNSPVLLVVPYFGESWTVGGRAEATFSLLLAAGNQPGLIP